METRHWNAGFFAWHNLELGTWNFESKTYLVGVTVLEVIQRSSEFLTQKGVESPRLQTELLLAHVLGLQRLQLYLNFERVLNQEELKQLRELVRRRGQRQPLQHLVGSTSFCGLEIAVSPKVLIPRPETELLAERAWESLSQPDAAPPQVVLDFGTGSGCLAIALAVKCPAVQIHALDISTEAITLARQNAARHNVADRIQFHAGDGFAALPAGLRFDLIVSNPPYIPSTAIDQLELEVRAHEPRPALDGGADGLLFYRRLASEASPFLKPTCWIMLELGDQQAGAVREIFTRQKWIVEAVEPDYTGRPRVFVARLPK